MVFWETAPAIPSAEMKPRNRTTSSTETAPRVRVMLVPRVRCRRTPRARLVEHFRAGRDAGHHRVLGEVVEPGRHGVVRPDSWMVSPSATEHVGKGDRRDDQDDQRHPAREEPPADLPSHGQECGTRSLDRDMRANELRQAFTGFFEEARPRRGALGEPHSPRPHAPVHGGRGWSRSSRTSSVRRSLLGRAPRRCRSASAPAAAQRPRRDRAHHPAPELLRDAGQLQLRGLLQEDRDPLRLGAQGAGARRRPAADRRPRQ